MAITVPVMGEGIRAARIVALLKKPGDKVALDEPLCEVETDKAVYPIEASFTGVFKEWLCKVDDVVEIGREIARVTTDAATLPAEQLNEALDDPPPSAPPQNLSMQQLQQAPRFEPPKPAVPGNVVPPALSPSITRRLNIVVPANLQLHAPWQAVRTAREAAKAAQLDYSPSLMISWCVVRAMEKHAAFRRLVQKDGSIVEREVFDLGVAVALEGDRLGTAVIRGAAQLGWKEFADAYAKAVAEVRAGRVEDVQAPVNITSLGAFGVETATPIVVPPAMATLFVGKSHQQMTNDGGVVYPLEVVTLSLTFDHRVVNGAGAAAFLQNVKTLLGEFQLPG